MALSFQAAGASGDVQSRSRSIGYKGGEQNVPRAADSAGRNGRAWRQVRCVAAGKVVFVNAVRQDGQLNAAAVFVGLTFLSV